VVSHEALVFASATAALIALGMSVIMVVSGERTRPNGLLAAATLVVALAVGTLPFYVHRVDRDRPELLSRFQGIFEVGAIVLYGLYLLAILASSSVSGPRAHRVRVCAWTIIALAGWHAVASFSWPVQRLNDYELGSGQPGALTRPGFWLFAAFWLVLALPFGVGWGLLARRAGRPGRGPPSAVGRVGVRRPDRGDGGTAARHSRPARRMDQPVHVRPAPVRERGRATRRVPEPIPLAAGGGARRGSGAGRGDEAAPR
jgi:hypothetical protein